MSLELVKFVVQAHFLERDEEGNIMGESHSQPVELFGLKALAKWMDTFDEQLAAVDG